MSGLTKHVLTNPAEIVVDSLSGLATLNPNVLLDTKFRVLYQKDQAPNTVSIISGGGSGHEPAHAGFVGTGMLTAAVAGSVFASPNVSQIRHALSLVHASKTGTSAGVLVVLKNYTGDVLHFGLAAEQTRASLSAEEGKKVRVLVVGDDVAVGRKQGGLVGRRGLAGTVLVYKIAGALAEQGGSLDDVESLAHYVAENVATYGVGLDHCHVPGTNVGESRLGADELELGMGIHNEAGFAHLKPYPPLPQLIETMLGSILSSTKDDPERGFLEGLKYDGKDEVVLLVNNLGSISQLEMGGIVKEAVKYLKDKRYILRRVLSGTYMTSLNMPGFSLTVLLLPRSGRSFNSAKILEYLDAKTNAPYWPWHASSEPAESVGTQSASEEVVEDRSGIPELKPTDGKTFVDAIARAAEALIKAEPEITRQDTIAGDGDAGLTLKDGATGILKAIKEGKIAGQNVIADILAIADVVEETMGGTSGALYSIFFSGLGSSLRAQAEGANASSVADLRVWTKAILEARAVLYKYTRARPPSRTLVDPLDAFATALSVHKDFSIAVEAAQEGAEATKHVQATAGRSAYVDQKALEKEAVPDPGAWGVWVLLQALRG